MDFREHSVVELGHRVSRGEVSARQLTTSALERIEALDPIYNAFVCVHPEQALADAAAIDQRIADGHVVGPLAGIPIGVKDLEDAAGFATRYGSVLSNDAVCTRDSVLVARLKAAGCVVVGKTTTPEYGHKAATDSPLTGITRNPWNLERSAGGSSGGSAVALATGMIPLATGSDGGGSIRIPSALCGLSGIKCTQGVVPNGGPTPPGSGLFTVKGPMALRARDLALVLDVCAGPELTDPFTSPSLVRGFMDGIDEGLVPKIAWSPTMGFASVDTEIASICAEAIERLSETGVEVIEIDDVWHSDPLAPWLSQWTALRANAQGHLRDTDDWDKIDPSLRFLIEWGLKLTGVDVINSLGQLHQLNLELNDVWRQAPLLLTPVCAGQTPVLGSEGTIDGTSSSGWVSFTYGLNATRNPAGTVNCGMTADGMPVGLQIVGPQFHDVQVLAAVAACEEIFGRVSPQNIGGHP